MGKEILPTVVKPWLFVAIFLGFALLPGSLLAKRRDPSMRIISFVVMGILGIEFLRMIGSLFSSKGFDMVAVSLAATGSLWQVIVTKGSEFKNAKEQGQALLGAAHLLAIMGLYRLSAGYGSLAVTIMWLVYAVGVIGFAFFRKDAVMAKSAVFVLGFAAVKALLYDAALAPMVLRIVCLMLTGAVLYGSGFLLRRISGWKA